MGSSRRPPRLITHATVDIPVVEASGVAVARIEAGVRVMVVGDRSRHLAVGVYADDQLGQWQLQDLGEIAGWPVAEADSQLEALAVDGQGVLALLREDPAEVLVVDPARHATIARIELAVPPWSALAGRWDDKSSRGEGLLLLRGGRLLVAKEKKPRALVEFGPAGTSPAGVSENDLLGPDEPWSSPRGDVRYHALAVWALRDEAKKTLGDISSLAVDADRSLWMLSDKSQALARLSLTPALPRGGGALRALDEVYRLPKGVSKPEGVASLGHDRVLVVLDTESTRGNGVVVTRGRTDKEQ